MKFKTLSLGLLLLATGILSLAVSGTAADSPPKSGPVHIGMVQTLFTDIPQWQINIAQAPFAALMKKQTGVDGKLAIAGDGLTVGKMLHENKYQLGIFQGIEFAWAQHKYHDLKPLMIAVSYHPILHANLVVREDNPATGFAGLVGKDLALPKRSKMHIQLFLNKGCNACGQADPCKHFQKVTRPESLVDALDHVLLGEIQATVVDDLGLEHYKDLKPGCFKRLKVIAKSEDFPTGVIAYRENGLDKETLAKFRQGMINAKNDTEARELMALFQLTGFEDVPANFADTLATIVRAYPPPDADRTEKTSTRP
jgi:ABC-type phosphate/phosphonate transport system substrate-binding protein